jgi:hypothetical protein
MLCLLPVIAQAVPQIMSYQGKLNDGTGKPVTGNVAITFTIYDAPTAGNTLWTEVWDGTNGTSTVTVKNGLFSVELGTYTPLAATIFDKNNLYLGIKVGSDSEMAPRQRFTSGAYAFRAEPISSIQYLSANADVPYTAPNEWNVVYRKTVPITEIWEIYDIWFSSGTASPYNCDWVPTDLRFQVNGIVYTKAGMGSLNTRDHSYNYINALYNNLFFAPPVKALAGQTVTIETFISAPCYFINGAWRDNDPREHCTSTCRSNMNGSTIPGIQFGIFYYKK